MELQIQGGLLICLSFSYILLTIDYANSPYFFSLGLLFITAGNKMWRTSGGVQMGQQQEHELTNSSSSYKNAFT